MHPAVQSVWTLGGGLIALLLAGCAGSGPRIASGPPGDGHVTSTVALEPPADLKMRSIGELRIATAMTGHVPPVGVGTLAAPEFPKQARTKRLGVIVIRVILTVDERGHVAAVNRDPQSFSTPTAFDREFDAAIAAVVQKWIFEPGYAVPLVPGKDGIPEMGAPTPEVADLEATFSFSETGGVAVSAQR